LKDAVFLQKMKGGILNMAKKITSKRIAAMASRVLRRRKSSKISKSIAGSALSQREKK